ncbi:hypothetical protein JCM10369A_44270 [Nocardioides pyridinolyticus]
MTAPLPSLSEDPELQAAVSSSTAAVDAMATEMRLFLVVTGLLEFGPGGRRIEGVFRERKVLRCSSCAVAMQHSQHALDACDASHGEKYAHTSGIFV